jgi:hypothetical protein
LPRERLQPRDGGRADNLRRLLRTPKTEGRRQARQSIPGSPG